MVLFASHRAVLKGGDERAFTDEVRQNVNFCNTNCKESPAICFGFKRKKEITRQCNNTLLEKVTRQQRGYS